MNLGPDTLLCEGTSYVLNATYPGATYLWNTNFTGPILNANTAGIYSVKVKLGNCDATDSVDLSFSPKLVFDLGKDTSFCIEKPIKYDLGYLFANAYTWQDNSNYSTYIATKSEKVHVKVERGACVKEDSVNLTLLAVAKPNLGPDTFFCSNEEFTLNPGSFASYLWNDQSTKNYVNPTHTGIYWVHVINKDGCAGTDSIHLDEVASPNNFIGRDTFLCSPDLLLKPIDSNITCIWQDGTTASEFHVKGYGTFTVKMWNEKGCMSEGSITIKSNCPPTVFTPNAFTVNGDGLNDVFKPTYINIVSAVFKIYDRWGKLVFETNDMNKGWDGKQNGQAMPADVYVYLIDYTDINNLVSATSGNVTLLR